MPHPGGFQPTDVAGLKLWLKADALSLNDGDPVTTWTDASGQGNDLTQATASKKPTYRTNVLNSKPTVRFDGGDNLRRASALFQGGTHTVFIVAKAVASAGSKFVFDTGADNAISRRYLQFTASGIQAGRDSGSGGSIVNPNSNYTVGDFILIRLVLNGASSVLEIDDVDVSGTISNNATASVSPFVLGARFSEDAGFYDSDICEFLIYEGVVASADQDKIEHFVEEKYFPVGTGPAGLDSLSAEIAFTTDPLSAAPVFTDITPYVLQGNPSRGKQHELGRYEAGEFFLKVNNRDGRFDPSNPASPHYPNIDTRKRIRLRATYAGITYPVFDGFIESWTDVSEDRANPEVEIRAVDGNKMLQGRSLTSSYRDAVLAISGSSLAGFYRCEEPFGSTVLVDDSGSQNHGSFDEMPEVGAQPLIDENGSHSFYFAGETGRGCLRPESVPGGQFSWTVAMWIRTGFPAADFRVLWQAQTPAGTLDVNGVAMQVAIQQGRLQFLHTQATPFYGAYIGSTYPVVGNITDGQRHFVVISRALQGAQIKAYVDGVDQPIFLDPGSTPTLPTDLGRMDHMFVGRGPSVAAADDDARFIGHIDEIAIWSGKQLSAAEVLNLWNAGSAPWGTDLTSDRITRVLDAVGWPAGLRNIDVGKSTAAPANQIVGGRSALEHMLKMEQAEDGALYFDEECKLTFHNRHWLLMPPQTTSQATFGDGAGELPYLLDRSSKPSRDDVDVINIARGRRRNGPTLKAEDATSKTKYGEKTDDLLELEIVSDLEVQDRVDYRVRRFKDARTRFKQLTITPTTTDPASLFPQALGRKLGDRITVKQRPIPGGWTFTANLRIDRIEHVFTRDQWETTWQLGSVDPDSYWILGTSQLGVDARLAY